MSQPLWHSPADIVRELLVQLGMGSDPTVSPGSPWPVYASAEPQSPDNCITVFDTQGTDDGRTMHGFKPDHFGIQVRVRAADHPTAWQKADAQIRVALCEGVDDSSLPQTVTLTIPLPMTRYTVPNFARIGQCLALGKEAPNSRRSIVTLNATVVIQCGE